MILSWRLLYFLFFLYRSVIAVAAQVILRKFTSLGDQGHYNLELQIGALNVVEVASGGGLESIRQLGFILTRLLGGIFHFLFLGNVIFVGWAFQALAFIGILAVLTRLEHRSRIPIFFVLLLPSFNIWSSIPSKEAVVVFGLGLFLTYIIDCYYNREQLRSYQILGFLIVIAIKPYYIPALIFFIVAVKFVRSVKQPATCVLFGGLLSLLLFALIYDQFWSFAQQIQYHLHPKEGSLSRGDIWQQPLDVIVEAPQAMLLSFFGPTFEEAQLGPLQMFSFLESGILLITFIMLMLRGGGSLPAFNFFLLLFVLFWILFLTHPLGAFNPGAAVRYRTAYLLLIVVALAVLPVRETFLYWRRRQPVSERAIIAKKGVLLWRKKIIGRNSGRMPV
jgi:hypothetical protein